MRCFNKSNGYSSVLEISNYMQHLPICEFNPFIGSIAGVNFWNGCREPPSIPSLPYCTLCNTRLKISEIEKQEAECKETIVSCRSSEAVFNEEVNLHLKKRVNHSVVPKFKVLRLTWFRLCY